MRLTGRRESNNVDDRRGMGMGTKAGMVVLAVSSSLLLLPF